MTYIELIAVRKPAEAQKSMLERLAKGDGFLNFVLASDDIQMELYNTYQQEAKPVVWVSPIDACVVALVLHEFTPEMPPSFPLGSEDITL